MNSTEIDNPRTWATYSVCEIMADRSRYGQPIRCVAIHPAYDNPTMSSSTEVRFDVRCEYIYIYISFFCFLFRFTSDKSIRSIIIYIPSKIWDVCFEFVEDMTFSSSEKIYNKYRYS